jgi:hypothetical protein
LGEKFTTNPVTGTGGMSVPLPVSPGRGKIAPELALTYDSGAGNGPYGLGWSIEIASISRRVDKNVPRYRDGPDAEGVFALSSAEDLVPTLRRQGDDWEPVARTEGDHRVTAYRPRTEALFARIERWSRVDTGETPLAGDHTRQRHQRVRPLRRHTWGTWVTSARF